MFGELVPLTVEQHAPEVQQSLGSLPAPSHARSVEAHGDEVAHGSLDGTPFTPGAERMIVIAKRV